MSTDENDTAKLNELNELLERLEQHKTYNQLDWYEPAPKQKEFHNAGKRFRQRMLMAGNQTGKTLAAGMEVAMHATGLYPDWWDGVRYKEANHWWVGGVTSDSTRDNPQRILLGRGRNWGTGTIPADKLAGSPSMARGTPDAVNSISVLHVSGGISTIKFKSYELGREKWQGETLDGIWCDEEPPADVYDEAVTRLNKRKGHMLLTFTPLLGMTEVVRRYLEPQPDDAGRKLRSVIHMTLDDATHYSEEEKREIESQYSEAMKEARVKGLPMFGEGLIYPIPDEQLEVEPFDIPPHYRHICGFDQGINHPSALVWIAYDADQDIAYIYDCWKSPDVRIADIVQAYRKRGDWIPVAWPHDVARRDPGATGRPFSELFRQEGMNMLPESASLDPQKRGPQPREPIIGFAEQRMRDGRLKVFRNLREWFREKNQYHRSEGQVVDENDDLMSAMHYALMELRSARPFKRKFQQPARAVDSDPLGEYLPSQGSWL
jgi:phage terminase large subunit-like protein